MTDFFNWLLNRQAAAAREYHRHGSLRPQRRYRLKSQEGVLVQADRNVDAHCKNDPLDPFAKQRALSHIRNGICDVEDYGAGARP